MQKWQYKTIYRTWKNITDKPEYVWSDANEIAHASNSLEERLEELGRFGWELAGVETKFRFAADMQRISGVETHYIFKQPIE